jgi:uncharacterized delta-60 repeat protein
MWSLVQRKARQAKPARRTPPSYRPRLEALEDRYLLNAGALDPTFGNGAGYVLSSVGGYANTVAVQPNGQIVIVGTTGSDFLVARYNANGSLDTSFGTGGYTATAFKKSITSQAGAVAIQSDGKILAAGFADINGTDEFAMARYNANGTLDTTFGNKGQVLTGQGGLMALQPDGKILASGSSSGFATLVRYNSNGTLDTTFGNGGILVTNFKGGGSLVIQADGKIVLAGTTTDPTSGLAAFGVARFNADGTTDSSFGSSGEVITHVGIHSDSFGRVALQADGKIVLSGEGVIGGSADLCLIRYNADGTLDTTFGTGANGIVTVAAPGPMYVSGESGAGVEVQSDGKIVATTNLVSNSVPPDIAAVRVNSDGTLDTSYGNGGWATVAIGYLDRLAASALQPDGRLLLVGQEQPTSSSSPSYLLLTRLLQSEPEIGSFTGPPNPVTSGSSTTLTASNITDGNPTSTITQVTFYYFDVTGNKVVLGYGTSDGAGDWILNFTVNLASGTYTLYAQAQDNYGVVGDPAALTLTVQ